MEQDCFWPIQGEEVDTEWSLCDLEPLLRDTREETLLQSPAEIEWVG